MSEPIFLTLNEVLKIHTRSLAEHEGSAMIDVAEKKKTKADLAEIFRKCARPEDDSA